MRDVYQAGALHQGLPHFLQRFLEVVGDDEPPFILSWAPRSPAAGPGGLCRTMGGNEPGDRPVVLGDGHALSRDETVNEFHQVDCAF